MSTDVMLGGSGVLSICQVTGPNTVGCAPAIFDNTYYPPVTYPNGACVPWDWQPVSPAPAIPTINYYWCNCCGYQTAQHCCKCTAKAMEEFAKLLAPKGTVPMATPTVADALLTQAKTRISEIQKRLDEVPALEAEVARLRRMVDAAEGK